jgi:hypothetical protein
MLGDLCVYGLLNNEAFVGLAAINLLVSAISMNYSNNYTIRDKLYRMS